MTEDSDSALRERAARVIPGGLWGHMRVQGLPRSLNLHPGQESVVTYRFVPEQRGSFEFAGCDLRLRSPLRLWRQRRRIELRQTVRVYPNFAPLARFALFSAEQASRVVGAHVRRNRGEGTEFHQLREYRVGDTLRQIDWKATQRARKLISRDYQSERNQQVLMLIDTGREATEVEEGEALRFHVSHAPGSNFLLVRSLQPDANGRLTAAEALGHREFVLTRLYESA